MEKKDWIELVRQGNRGKFNDLRCGHGPQSHVCVSPHPCIDLGGCDFSGMELERFNFSGCNLRGANFEGCSLGGVDFDGADIREVNFRNVRYEHCSFQGADLRGADFRGAEEGYFSMVTNSDERVNIFEDANTEGTLWS